MPRARNLILLGVAAILIVALFLLLRETGWFQRLTDQSELRRIVGSLGALGPAAIVGLLALAIIMSPIPSAPIAIAAGALYGPIWGTVLTVAGAELGAVVAFGIARYLAYDTVRRWSAIRGPMEWLERGHSQTWLMLAVFLSRLLPFVSFDVISYAAGLTPLTFWRFAIATLAGVIPISFLLAFSGDALLFQGEANPVLTILAFGGITLVPFVLRFFWIRSKTGRSRSKAEGAEHSGSAEGPR